MYITMAFFTLRNTVHLLANIVTSLSLPLVSLTRAQLGQRESDRMLTPAPDLSNSFASWDFQRELRHTTDLSPYYLAS